MKNLNTFAYKVQITFITGKTKYFKQNDVFEIDEFVDLCQSINAEMRVDKSIFASDEYELFIRERQDDTYVYFKIFMPFDSEIAQDIEDSIN